MKWDSDGGKRTIGGIAMVGDGGDGSGAGMLLHPDAAGL